MDVARRMSPSLRRTVTVLTWGAVGVVLVWSRYALLASGAWEWDESNFARALVEFDLAAHFPHPPGFPGWIAIGELVRRLIPEPLVALQVASATASLVTVVLLTLAARRVVATTVAASAAVLTAFLPGVWLHAERGFASTAASAFAVAAAVVLLDRYTPVRLTAAAALATAAVLTRPQLAPVAALIWFAGAWRAPRWRDLVPGATVAAAMTGLATAAMAHASGGWAAMVAAFVDHGSRHMSRLAWNEPTVADLGFVKGLGGTIAAIAVGMVAVFGLDVWRRRRGWREALVYGLVLLTLVLELVFLHNRTYTRYAVPLLVALAPAAAAGIDRIARSNAIATAILGAGAVAAFAYSLPLVVEQHRQRLPGFAAVEFAHEVAARNGLEVVEEGSLHPLVSYHWYARRDLTGDDGPPLVLSPWAPEPWAGITGHYLVVTDHRSFYLGPLVAGSARWTGPSARLEPFTQRRMLDASVLADAPLPVGQWWPVEHPPDGIAFMWGGTDCAFDLPPLPADTRLVVELQPARGPAPLEVRVDDDPVTRVAGDGGVHVVVVPARRVPVGRPFRLGFSRSEAYPPGGEDQRPLAVQVRSLRAVGPSLPWSGSVASAADRARIAIDLSGVWPAETFGPRGRAAWTRPEAMLRVPAGAGTLTLRAWAPRPTPARALATLPDGRSVPLQLTSVPADHHIPLAAVDGDTDAGIREVTVRLLSDAFVPAEAGTGADRRELGFVVSEVAFAPPGVSPRPAWWAGAELTVPEAQPSATP